MGAWIEISVATIPDKLISVAPLVGAWIEIALSILNADANTVAPLVGAWIEIFKHLISPVLLSSLPSWERGLKYYYVFAKRNILWIAPLVGAWIEIE